MTNACEITDQIKTRMKLKLLLKQTKKKEKSIYYDTRKKINTHICTIQN